MPSEPPESTGPPAPDNPVPRVLRGPLRLLFGLLEPLAPRLGGRLAVQIFRTVPRFKPPRRELGWVASGERISIPSRVGPLAAWSWGPVDGAAVLLVHGWMGRGSQMGAFAAPLAERGFRAVAVDAPGHGDSRGWFSSLPEFQAAVEATAAAVGPPRAIVAHSFGTAATARAMLARLRVERLVFVSAAADLSIYPRRFSGWLGLGPKTLKAMVARLERRFAVDWKTAARSTILAADETPLLLVHDREDRETPFSGAREIAAAWPNGRLLETEGLGHRRILRDPRVVAAVTEFIAGARANADLEPN